MLESVSLTLPPRSIDMLIDIRGGELERILIDDIGARFFTPSGLSVPTRKTGRGPKIDPSMALLRVCPISSKFILLYPDSRVFDPWGRASIESSFNQSSNFPDCNSDRE